MTDSKNLNENVAEEVKDTNATNETLPTQTEETKKTEEKPLTVADFSEEAKTETKEEVKEAPKNEETPKALPVTVVTPTVKGDNGPDLKNMSEEFICDIMSVPACTHYEYRVVTYIMMWARKRGIRYDFDKKGNIYLTKGEIAEGEFYPCLTSHLDTVQDKQKPYAEAGMRLPLKHTLDTKGNHKVSIDGMGIGADDRAGIAICLTIMEKFDTIKAAFFLEEEIGMIGSNELDVHWFDNVGYVIGYDSPELNRAAWKCSGERLFDKDVFEEYIEPICKKHGLTDFRSEPITDVVNIRKKTNITCMNFGNGGYLAHSQTEYIILEDMDTACGMGIELVETMGNKFYECIGNKKADYTRNADGTYASPQKDDNDEYFNKKFTRYYGGYNYGGTHSGYNGNNYHYSGGTGSSTSGSSTTPSTTTPSTIAPKKEDTVPTETVQYISEKYDEEINRIKKEIKSICEKQNLNFDEVFASVFAEEIKF